MGRSPDHRFRAVRAATEAPENPIERALWNVLHDGEADLEVARAHQIYTELQEREILQAWIVAGADDAVIERVLHVRPGVTRAYRHLFFDIGVFPDELALLPWISHYGERSPETAYGAQLLKVAMLERVDGLLSIFERGAMSADPKKVLEQVMVDSYRRGRAHRLYGIGSAEAKAALASMATAAKIAVKVAENIDEPNLLTGLRIKLKYRDDTTSIDKVSPEDMPLH